jgi:hypothetical protein
MNKNKIKTRKGLLNRIVRLCDLCENLAAFAVKRGWFIKHSKTPLKTD